MKLRQNGFSLIELMIVVAMLGILISLAAPSFRGMMLKRSASAAADAWVTDLKFTRSEALRRTTTVSMCSSSDGTSCLTGTASWKSGWIIWVDDKVGGTEGTLDSGEAIIRVQGPLSSIESISVGIPSNDYLKYVFWPLGMAKPTVDGAMIVTPVGGGNFSDGSKRVICVSSTGRPALRAVGTTSCS